MIFRYIAGTLVVAAVIAMLAAVSAKQGRVRLFVLGIVGSGSIAVASIVVGATNLSMAKRLALGIIGVAPAGVLFLIWPGLAVKNQSGPAKAAGIAVIATILGSPFWLYWLFWIGCAIDDGSCL